MLLFYNDDNNDKLIRKYPHNNLVANIGTFCASSQPKLSKYVSSGITTEP